MRPILRAALALLAGAPCLGARWEPSANFAVGGGVEASARPGDEAAAREDASNAALLRRYPRSALFARRLGPDFKAVGWSGDYQRIPDRKAAVRALVNSVEDEHDEDARKPVKLVCEGHGCGIALEALDELNDKGLRVARLVTLDAKLTRLLWQGKPDRPPNVKEWVHLYTREQTRGESDRRAAEEAKARSGRGIESFCAAAGLGAEELEAAAAEAVRAEGSAAALLAEGYPKAFTRSECRAPAAASKPAAQAQPAPARAAPAAAAKPAPAAAEKESLRGPRLLIQGAIDLARRLAKRTRDQVSEVRSEKQRRREELLAKKREDDERKRSQAAQADQSYPWDPQSSWSTAASGPGAGSGAGAAAAPGVYGASAGGGQTGVYRPAGAGGLSAFPQGGVKPQFTQQGQQGGGP